MRKLRKRFKRRIKSEGGAPVVQRVPYGISEYLSSFILGVSLTIDFYLIQCVDNTKLHQELLDRYDGMDSELLKREKIYEDLMEKVNLLWRACRDVKDMVDIQAYLSKVIKLFEENANRYLRDSEKYADDEFASNIFEGLCHNELTSARMIREKYVPYAFV